MSNGQKISFWNFINSNVVKKVEIPIIQRDYVQGREDAKIQFSLNRLLDDIYMALYENKTLDLNYIYGKVDDGVFIPIDGQQRLTTLLTLHIYAFSKEKMSDKLEVLKNKFEYKTRVTTRRFLKELIDKLFSYFDDKYDTIDKYIYDAAWFSPSWKRDPSVRSFINVLKAIETKFKNKEIAERLMNNSCPITYMQLSIDNMGNENDLYIKMNSRGKLLTDFEIFKSELFDYVDSKIIDKSIEKDFGYKFKVLMDTEWNSMLWDYLSKKAQDVAKKCDNYYLKLLKLLLLNVVLPPTSGEYDKLLKNLNNDDKFINFQHYKTKLEPENKKSFGRTALFNIYYTFEFLKNLTTNEEIFTAILNEINIENVNQRNRVMLHAITKYATDMKGQYQDAFVQWYRIVKNLVHNTAIDKEDRYCNACLALESINKQACENSIEYFSNLNPDKIELPFFNREQLSEEILKAKLICKNQNWEEPIVIAEKSDFDGEIRFMFKLQSIDFGKLPIDDLSVQKFIANWKIIDQIFGETGILKKNNDLFRRALLTFGNYSILAGSSQTFFYESRDFSWRRMLKENSFGVFSKFFDDLKSKNPQTNESIIAILENYISDYNDIDDFKYNFIKYPELFEYMRQKRYREDTNYGKNRIVIYSKERLSADYAEVNTFALSNLIKNNGYGNVTYKFGKGYFDSDTSEAFLTLKKEENEYRIEFYNDCFYLDNEKILDSCGKEINNVPKCFEAIKNKMD